MSETREFNPIAAAAHIEEAYREYIATTIHFDNAEYQSQLEEILRRKGFLAKGPFLESAPPYTKDRSVTDLVDEGVLCRGMLRLGNGNPEQFDCNRPLYVHQVRAIKKAVQGRNYVVVSGTGSGKTECFLLPILNDILTEFETTGPQPGVRAMMLYPMNALANDQLKRLRTLLQGTGITFGRYTGDTEEDDTQALLKWQEENPGQKKLPNEIISRTEIRKNPPNILLTNYSMLEYLLLRPKDAALFGKAFGGSWRHIAIDEAHVYSGALGTEIAYLLRRLKARIAAETGATPQLHCYATSATIGSEEDLPKIARFASDLFGEPFSVNGDDLDVITSERDLPQDALEPDSWGALPLEAWAALRRALLVNDAPAESICEILRGSGVPKGILNRMEGVPMLLGLGRVLLGEASTATLVSKSAKLIDLTDLAALENLGIPGLRGDDEGVETLTAMVEVLSSAQRTEGVPILSSRYHSFLRAPEGLFLNLHTQRLSPHKNVAEPYGNGDPTPVYEVSVCRHCGQAYILGQEASDILARTAWLNPQHEGLNADDDFLPRKYFRLLESIEDKDEDEGIYWLCPICGSLHDESDGGAHRFAHEDVARIPLGINENEATQADEETARCRHCGYQSRIAIQPMRVSPEAAGSVVCYELVRDIPPFDIPKSDDGGLWELGEEETRKAGSVICFSDRRQDAAFFAPALERTYNSITRRQLIREAVDARGAEGGCSPSAAIDWIASEGSRRYPEYFADSDPKNLAEAWMVDELAAEDSRNSLDGLGVVRIEPTLFNQGFADERIRRYIGSKIEPERFPWLGVDDFIVLAKVCLETLRERNTIEVSPGVEGLRNNHEQRPNSVFLGDGEAIPKDSVAFVGSSAASQNKRALFIRKYAQQIHGVKLGTREASDILRIIFDFLVQYLGGQFRKQQYLKGANVHQSFRLNKNIWTLYPHRDDDIIFRCDTCGCETHLDTAGVCTTLKCEGKMQRMTFAEAFSKDRFYKTIYQEEALPLEIEEHTAQLSSKEAREIQSGFINGRVNVLSCTTTFELGVDVGDLRAVFMRNIPPSTANYTQRAGRVGRRAGKPGYAVTFARLRPHDLAHFSNPANIIAGQVRVPMCYLDNPAIAIRHVFAVALSEYFRHEANSKGPDCLNAYHSFLNLDEEKPEGLADFNAYLASHPESISRQLTAIIPPSSSLADAIGLADWSWTDNLVGMGDRPEGTIGRLTRIHMLKHDDYQRVKDAFQIAQGTEKAKASELLKRLGALEKNQKTIEVLAESGILPKYGFPTDLVELQLPELGVSSESRLSLSRGLRQAISEYAPGAEIVAGKKLWKSVGIRQLRGHEKNVRRFGKCHECGSFIWPIENFSDSATCPVCKTEVALQNRMLIPDLGFEGREIKKGVGLRRPRSKGYATVYFSQRWPEEAKIDTIAFPGGAILRRFAGNGQLCALNSRGRGFQVCEYCGAAAPAGEVIDHWKWCNGNGKITTYTALGASFMSDVLELSLEFNENLWIEEQEWSAVMWAIVTAAAQILEIPETEVGGTFYKNERNGTSILLYDNVPGGAGHALQLSGMVETLLREAYRVVDGHCGCGEDTCCYGCIANYYNQSSQAVLSRGTAKRVLGQMLGLNMQ